MALITLISDYGLNSPYVASIKGAILSANQNLTIVDITHSIKSHDVLQAAYILKTASRNFPDGTIHIISVDTSLLIHGQFLVVVYNKQYFIAADNGIFSLLFNENPEKVYAINHDLINQSDLFPDKNLFTKIALKILNNEHFDTFLTQSQIKNIKQNIAPVVEENLIRGNIIFIDGYGNAVTNISRKLFEQKLIGGKKFSIFYRRKQKINRISKNYSDVKSGNEVALFNEEDLLEIAMNTGKAEQLLGLKENNPVIIEFYDK